MGNISLWMVLLVTLASFDMLASEETIPTTTVEETDVSEEPATTDDNLLETTTQNSNRSVRRSSGSSTKTTRSIRSTTLKLLPIFDESGLIWQEITVNKNAKVARASIMTNKEYRIHGNTYLPTQCAAYCKKDSNCRSFAFSSEQHSCHMYKFGVADEMAKISIKSSAQFDLYPKDAFIASDEIWGPCAKYPCKNGGVCIDDVSNGMDYKCVCPSSHWKGENCDIKALDPQWDSWSMWGECSASCGAGWKSRSRICKDKLTNQQITHLECYGSPLEVVLCEKGPCPAWDTWSAWGECSTNTTCGTGTRYRTRPCLHVGANGRQQSDRGCMANSKESQPCHVTACNNVPIQFIGGKVYGEGRVLIYNNVEKQWGQVCNSKWEMNDANVVCRQLGLSKAHEVVASADAEFGGLSEPFIMSGLECQGGEIAIQNCKHDGWHSSSKCAGGTGGAAVRCVVDGIWGTWSGWGDCDRKCGNGTSKRMRQCDHPPATHGGKKCPGIDTESKPCFITPCPVDGVWLEWNKWGVCNLNCGNGTQIRTRQCLPPRHDGRWCLGPANETQLCNTHHCPVDGVWNNWQPWSPCNRDCDGGKQHRSRTCHGPFYGGLNCTGDETTVQDCNTHNCPVKGKWKQWSDWTQCNETCGGGRQSRVRECNYGLFGGENCTGISYDERDCNTHHCPVDGYFHEWQPWQTCSESCSNGTQIRKRTCEPPRYNGTECSGRKQQEQPCKLRECPVNGEWGAWGVWTDCTHTCGNGTKTRTRDCIGQAHGGNTCPGSDNDTAFCYIKSCAIHGVWMEWGSWSDCSATCGNRTRSRARKCDGPYFGGDACPGNETDVEECQLVYCPIHGVWKEWNSWGTCSESCGNGTQTRDRQCTGPFYNGKTCSGDSTEEQQCNTHPCPVDGQWEQWKSWTECSKQCAGGIHNRTRVCHGKANGGADCGGEGFQSRTCNTHPCPVDGVLSSWSNWQQCSVSCDNGTQKRSRFCTPPKHGGKPCTGKVVEERFCHLVECPIDGVFESWSSWQPCSLTCGGGRRTRERTCQGPYYNGKNCTGPWVESEDCSMNACPVNGSWNSWSGWMVCDKTCGGGFRERRRTCNQPLYGGLPCTGQSIATENCNDNPCPVDGSWSEWSRWLECDATCGGGLSKRYRICTLAKHGGKSCDGSAEEFRPCNNVSCPIDGKWFEWSMWSSCTESCGSNSTRRRGRTCSGPYHGGKPCEGEYINIEKCQLDQCPIDGVPSNWSQWSACSKSCGIGLQMRNRTCIGPFHGGRECQESLIETKECLVNECPVDGVASEWSAWTQCSASCGWGKEFRLRTCNGPFYGGKSCPEHMKESQNCTIKSCPVGGVFTEWSPWSSCNVTCGGGFTYRNRSCDGPYFGGAECQGDLDDRKECNMHNCPVDGIFHAWSPWSGCTVSCGGGTTKRLRHCIGPFHGGKECLGARDQTESCNTYECPVDGFWQSWSNWDQCNKTCNTGYQTRYRVCTPPRFGGRDCIGESEQKETCNTHNCPVTSYYKPWSPWSDCLGQCGRQQTRKRSRVCHSTNQQQCSGPAFQSEICANPGCKVDGRFEAWSSWTQCDKTCGTGIQLRNRTCIGPFHGGLDCIGKRIETVECNKTPCPLEGTWSPWTLWETCSVSCGGGIRHRQRSCQLNSTLYQTLPCSGNATQSEKCHQYSCTPLQSSCENWKAIGMVDNCLAEILVDGIELVVRCNMQMEGGIGVNVIEHNFKDKEVLVSGYEGAGEYQQQITYTHIDIFDLATLKFESRHCKQKITWRCYAASITIPTSRGTRHVTFWENVDGQKRYNWGGAPWSGKCTCGMTDTCVKAGTVCNCDANDEVWRTDTGWITEIDDLPVTKIRAGDTGSQEGLEQGYWSLGPLICY